MEKRILAESTAMATLMQRYPMIMMANNSGGICSVAGLLTESTATAQSK